MLIGNKEGTQGNLEGEVIYEHGAVGEARFTFWGGGGWVFSRGLGRPKGKGVMPGTG